jgi:hypothetical protein
MTLTPDTTHALALSLLHADSEAEVISILETHGLWEQEELWRLYGDRDGNFSVIGNQQSRPEAALVEKIVNSVDARLMNACSSAGIDATSDEAPKSIRDAVATFIQGVEPDQAMAGLLRFWDGDRQLEESKSITLAVTGMKPREGMPCITISDAGEGQTPDRMPDTFLSIDRENKLRIPFVQGKFNMGGTGALKFCGKDGIQLVITKRSPEASPPNSDSSQRDAEWGFTVVRRMRPKAGAGAVRNSVYRYLAPVGADANPGKGSVLSFPADSIKAMPDQNKAYARELKSGSLVKLYEYDMKGFSSHILMGNGLLSRLEILLPGIALPVRLHECRNYRGSEERSFANTLVGFSARLEDNKNLEDGFPTSSHLRVAGEDLSAEIYVFKAKKATAYRRQEGIIFTINGQTHGSIHKNFFARKRVKMGRLADSLLVVVNCSKLSVAAREDLFMNSRDRLSDGALRNAIEEALQDLIARHHGLRELAERRRQDEIASRLEDSKPLEEVLGSILKSSPSLSRLFLLGQRLNRPHRTESDGHDPRGGEGGSYVGQPHPSYFHFAKKKYNTVLSRETEVGRRCRIKFETDVANDYFTRDAVRGRYSVEVLEGLAEDAEVDHAISLHDGIANWTITLPDALEAGDEVTVQCTVEDDTLLEPFVNVARIRVLPAREHQGKNGKRRSRSDKDQGKDPGGNNSGQGKKGKSEPGGIKLPRVLPVKKGDEIWVQREFDDSTGTEVVDDGVEGDPSSGSELTFYVNTSNLYLLTDMKGSRVDPRLTEAKFVFGNVLVGLALMNDASGDRKNGGDDEGQTPAEIVASTTRALAPFLLPMIDYLGALTSDGVSDLGLSEE